MPRLGCAIVCGAANNQLADDSLAGELMARGILYAPDFIANAGGLINVAGEVLDYGQERAVELTLGIEDALGRVLARAEAAGVTPLEAAEELARQRLEAGALAPA